MNELCPCGSGALFSRCCEPIIQGQKASKPEALMRSRYSAYVKGCWGYLHASWHPDTRPSSVSPTSTRWLGLEIIRANQSEVEFVARFMEGTHIMLLHETSRFTRMNGHWYYIDGKCELSKES